MVIILSLFIGPNLKKSRQQQRIRAGKVSACILLQSITPRILE